MLGDDTRSPASFRRGATFSLFQSPSKAVSDIRARLGLGVASGVGGSHVPVVAVDADDTGAAVDDDDGSEQCARFPNTLPRVDLLRVCIMARRRMGKV